MGKEMGKLWAAVLLEDKERGNRCVYYATIYLGTEGRGNINKKKT